jgi:tetratricopeptide (TPR) repeat protein
MPDISPQVTALRLRPILPAELDDPIVASRNLGFAYAELASSTARAEFQKNVVEMLQPLAGTSVADTPFWQNLGEAYLALGEIAHAEEAFRNAAALDPVSAGAHYSLGYVFQLRGNLAEAIRSYRRALEADPDKAEVLGNLAAAYATIGKPEDAKKALESALKLEPGNLRWRTSLATIAGQPPRPGK